MPNKIDLPVFVEKRVSKSGKEYFSVFFYVNGIKLYISFSDVYAYKFFLKNFVDEN